MRLGQHLRQREAYGTTDTCLAGTVTQPEHDNTSTNTHSPPAPEASNARSMGVAVLHASNGRLPQHEVLCGVQYRQCQRADTGPPATLAPLQQPPMHQTTMTAATANLIYPCNRQPPVTCRLHSAMLPPLPPTPNTTAAMTATGNCSSRHSSRQGRKCECPEPPVHGGFCQRQGTALYMHAQGISNDQQSSSSIHVPQTCTMYPGEFWWKQSGN